MEKFFKRERGITLIALVITIVILIILAGVLINLTLGDNGLFTRAMLAKEKYEYSAAKEILDIKLIEIEADYAQRGEKAEISNYASKLGELNEKQISILHYYFEPQANIASDNSWNETDSLSGIVVRVNTYQKYKFLIGEGNDDKAEIIGVTKGEIPEEWDGTPENLPDGFEPPKIFETNFSPSGNPTEPEIIEDGEITSFIVSKNIETLSKNTTFTISGTSTTKDIAKVELKIGNVVVYTQNNLKTNNYNNTINTNSLSNLNQLNYGETYEVKAILTQRNNETTEAMTQNIVNKTVGNVASLQKIANIANGTNGETQSNFSNQEILQVADINLTGVTWNPIGQSSNQFSGTYDGNNKKIEGLSISNTENKVIGLFGFISSDADIKNIELYGTLSQNTERAAAGIVAVNYGTVDGCKNYATISSTSSEAGGIVGNNHGTIINCYNEGEISGREKIGGISGFCYSDTINVQNCTNNGHITANISSVGGIVGSSHADISNCKNGPQAVIQSNGSPTDFSQEGTGGIVGVTTASVSRSYNKGTVSTTGFCAGGIVGHGSTNTIISESFNNGSVSATQNLAGGIIARRAKEINNCYNYIKGTASISSNTNTGGIMGNCSDVGVAINNCYCIGDNIVATGTGAEGTKGLAIAALYYSGIEVNKFYYLDNSSINVFGTEQSYAPTTQNVENKSDTNFKLPSNDASSVTYLLNPTTGSAIWGKDNSINDGYPYLLNNH